MNESRIATVLVALDFSKSSIAAFSVGLALCLRLNAQLVLLHVLPSVPHHRYAVPTRWMVEEMRASVSERMTLARNRAIATGIETRTIVLNGSSQPDALILDTAAKLDNPVVVLGTHSRTGIERFLLGSTAECVLREAECPVITTGPRVVPYWSRGIQHVMLATDLTERSLNPLPFLAQLWSSEIRLSVVHVVSPDAALTSDDWQRAIRQRIKEVVPQSSDAQITMERVAHNDVVKVIHQMAQARHTDLLAIGVHHAKALTTHERPRTAFELIMSAPCACLSVRA